MKVLRVHNSYQQTGGEDVAELAEQQLLRDAGHEVVSYRRHNGEIDDYGPWQRATLPLRTVWAWDAKRDLAALIARERPDVAHFTNTFPLISPAAWTACRSAGVAVVQSLHNFRLLCPAANFLREGRVCEDCVDHSLLRSVRHACYRDSRGASLTVAAMLAAHRTRGSFTRDVDAYVALTRFARDKFAAGGLPVGRIFVKPNFVAPDPGPRDGPGERVLFAGRLSREKGCATLLEAWQKIESDLPLVIAGDGPDRDRLRALAAGSATVEWLGAVPRETVLSELERSRMLVFPSECYEAFGMTIAEAFACGVPVIASRLGAMAELVDDGRTGLLFPAGDAAALAERIAWALAHPEELRAMGCAARREFETHYTAAANATMLEAIYAAAIERARAGG